MNKFLNFCGHCLNANTDECDRCYMRITDYGNASPSQYKAKYSKKEEQEKPYEYVDHPSHYGGEDNPYECIKVIEAWGLDKNFDLGTAVRYICRAGEKPDNPTLQDLKKARWYLDREIQKLEKNCEIQK